MPTVVQATVPAEKFALHHTLSTVPGLSVECERLVLGGKKSVMPLVWMRGTDRGTLNDVLNHDSTVESISYLSASDENDHLCRIQWNDRVRHLLEMVTNGKATVLDIHSRGDQWYLRVLYPTRDHFSRTHNFATEHGFAIDVTSIRNTADKPDCQAGLTEGQREVLVQAAQQGYFDVPREVDLSGLAADCEVSHQALSERLRRGVGTLIENRLLTDDEPEEPEKLSI